MIQQIHAHVASSAPDGSDITEYDRLHFATYARLVGADDAGEDWRIVASHVLGLDVENDSEAARRCWQSHLSRAHWIATEGYRLLLAKG